MLVSVSGLGWWLVCGVVLVDLRVAWVGFVWIVVVGFSLCLVFVRRLLVS